LNRLRILLNFVLCWYQSPAGVILNTNNDGGSHWIRCIFVRKAGTFRFSSLQFLGCLSHLLSLPLMQTSCTAPSMTHYPVVRRIMSLRRFRALVLQSSTSTRGTSFFCLESEPTVFISIHQCSARRMVVRVFRNSVADEGHSFEAAAWGEHL
jgi:hypothetical protein